MSKVEQSLSPGKEFGQEWVFIGDEPGGKTGDLLAFERLGVPDLPVLKGISIGASVCDEFLRAHHINPESATPLDIANIPIDEVIPHVIDQLLKLIPDGSHVAIRSSAVGEHSGNGIYHSDFLYVSPKEPRSPTNIASVVQQIYASLFTPQARAWGDTTTSPRMGILVQPVVGSWQDRGTAFLPTLSGVVTMQDGQHVLRLVAGLGTRAVDTIHAYVARSDTLAIPEWSTTPVQFDTADAIDSRTDLVSNVASNRPQVLRSIGALAPLVSTANALAAQGTPWYMEFAIANDRSPVTILQAHPLDKKRSVRQIHKELPAPVGQVLLTGSEAVNTGIKPGRGIIWLGLPGQSLWSDDLDTLLAFNRTNHDYFLIVPDFVMSKAHHKEAVRASFAHFSNAAGMIELQFIQSQLGNQGYTLINHVGLGGTHFAEVCSRKDIHYMGAVIENDQPLYDLLGPPSIQVTRAVAYWDDKVLLTTTRGEGRLERTSDTVIPRFSPIELHDWAMELRKEADSLQQLHDPLADSWYQVSNHMADQTIKPFARFDPFTTIAEGERDQLLQAIRAIVPHLHELPGYEIIALAAQCGHEDEYRLQTYLETLIDKLAS